jgi:hypothetical protein
MMRSCSRLVPSGSVVAVVPMNSSSTHPYTLQVSAVEKTARHFHWAIRKHGRLLQRSDRPQATEYDARKRGMAEIEKILHGGDERR